MSTATIEVCPRCGAEDQADRRSTVPEIPSRWDVQPCGHAWHDGGEKGYQRPRGLVERERVA